MAKKLKKLLGAFTYHHDSAKVHWRAFVESEADALQKALQTEYQLVLRESHEDVLARAREAGSYGTLAMAGYDDESHEEDTSVVVWDFEDGGERNLGCGPGDDTDKRENVWVHVEEWTPDPVKAAEYRSLSKDDLVQRLLEVEAVHM